MRNLKSTSEIVQSMRYYSWPVGGASVTATPPRHSSMAYSHPSQATPSGSGSRHESLSTPSGSSSTHSTQSQSVIEESPTTFPRVTASVATTIPPEIPAFSSVPPGQFTPTVIFELLDSDQETATIPFSTPILATTFAPSLIITWATLHVSPTSTHSMQTAPFIGFPNTPEQEKLAERGNSTIAIAVGSVMGSIMLIILGILVYMYWKRRVPKLSPEESKEEIVHGIEMRNPGGWS